jgi:alkylation response protein AidB-like acyl-CoA dehydrogenase
VDFKPNGEQLALQQGIRSFCDAQLGLEGLRESELGQGFADALWQQFAELGVFQLRVAEAQGGLGLGAADAVLVFEELGRALAPGPLVWSVLARDWVAGVADGRAVVGGLDLLTPSSQPHLIEHRGALDALLLLRPEGVFLADLAVLEALPVGCPLDPLTPIHHAEHLPDARQLAGPVEALQLQLEGMSLVAAQLLGIAEATLDIALAYAKEREQFGRTIGSFQAIKHMLADMFARQELARASVYAAGALLDYPEADDPAQAVRGAKLIASEAARRNARDCIQIHGGIGYTWEVADHYYLKRARVLEASFCQTDELAEQIANQLARISEARAPSTQAAQPGGASRGA